MKTPIAVQIPHDNATIFKIMTIIHLMIYLIK